MVWWETLNYEQPKVDTDKIIDSTEKDDDTDIVEFNNNPTLAQEEANRIIEGLPNTLPELSTDQQKKFAKLVGPQLNLINLWENTENVPDVLPEWVIKDLQAYLKIRNPENFSKLSPSQQEALKMTEKEAFSEMTKHSENVIGSELKTNPWEREPSSDADIAASNQWDERNGWEILE
jgi:hypothetical protein